jgi:hypothetical protein
LPVPAAADANPREDLVSFDCAAVQVVWKDHSWQLVAGECLLKDFGRREAEARQALRLIQILGLNQRSTVGRPQVVMEYWLAGGRGPTGLTPGLRRLTLDGARLRVEQVQTQWCVRDEQRILFHFGPHQGEAERALAILKKYRFTQLGVLGQAAPSMMVFFSEGPDLAQASRTPSALRVPRTFQKPTREGDKNVHLTEGAIGALAPATLPPLRTPPPRTGARGVLQPGLPGWEERAEVVAIDGRQVQLRRQEGAWSLAAGDFVLARFGSDEAAARQALQVLRHYHFTELCRVGRPAPVFSYYLVNGQAPRGLTFGLVGQAFQPDKLSVQPLGRQWALCEGDKVLVVLGESAADAHQLLAAVQRNRFDRLCRVGPAPEGMTFFVRVR